jgi:hypothetical protein
MDAMSFIAGLRRHGFVKLGGGCFSEVYAKPGSDRCIKVCFRTDAWPAYVFWASDAGHAGTLAPRVFSFKNHGDWYVAVMERLASTVVNHWGQPAYQTFRQLATAMSCGTAEPDLEFALPGAGNFVREFAAAGLNTYTDLHDENFMLRFDGSMVCTDPITTTNDTSWTNTKRRRSGDMARTHAAA